jgi:hypothetical protein
MQFEKRYYLDLDSSVFEVPEFETGFSNTDVLDAYRIPTLVVSINNEETQNDIRKAIVNSFRYKMIYVSAKTKRIVVPDHESGELIIFDNWNLKTDRAEYKHRPTPSQENLLRELGIKLLGDKEVYLPKLNWSLLFGQREVGRLSDEELDYIRGEFEEAKRLWWVETSKKASEFNFIMYPQEPSYQQLTEWYNKQQEATT